MKKAKENWIGEQCSEIEENLRKNKSKTAYEIQLGLVGSEMCIRDRTETASETLGKHRQKKKNPG